MLRNVTVAFGAPGTAVEDPDGEVEGDAPLTDGTGAVEAAEPETPGEPEPATCEPGDAVFPGVPGMSTAARTAPPSNAAITARTAANVRQL
jgi:hypothetical protein